MKNIFFKYVDYAFWIITIFLFLLIAANRFIIQNYFEFNDIYGIDIITVTYGLNIKNLTFSISLLIISILITLKITHFIVIKFSNINYLSKTSILISLYLTITIIIASLHSIYYFSNDNARYDIDKNLLSYEINEEKLKLDGSIQRNYKNLKILDTLKSIVEKQESYSYSIKRTIGLFATKNEIRESGYLRYDFNLENEFLKIYFRTFDINRSIRFDYKNETFPLALDFSKSSLIYTGKKDSLLMMNSFQFYNQLENGSVPKKIQNTKFLEIIELLKFDRQLAIKQIKENYKILKKYKINWDVFYYDTLFKAIKFDQSYLKGVDIYSRNLLFIQGFLLLIPLLGSINILTTILSKSNNQQKLILKSRSNKKYKHRKKK